MHAHPARRFALQCGAASPSRLRRAFTLVELLVVIGIIVILMAILLPAVSKVRISAQRTRTASSMSAIAAAIERYYNDERAYPGLFSNQQLAGAVAMMPSGSFKVDGTATTNLTGSENLVLSLLGGGDGTWNSSTNALQDINVVTAAATTIGKGPMNFATSPMYRTRKGAYIDAAPGTLLPPTPFNVSGIAANDPEQIGTPPTTKDTPVPEFRDNYGTPRPILYLRANTSAANIASVMTTKNPTGAALCQYTTYEFTYYKRGQVVGSGTAAEPAFAGDFNFAQNATITSVDFYKSEIDYLTNPNLTNTARGKDKYILISAGDDRTFGTKDDIIVGGS